MVRITSVSLTDELLEDGHALARRTGLSFSALVRRLLREALSHAASAPPGDADNGAKDDDGCPEGRLA